MADHSNGNGLKNPLLNLPMWLQAINLVGIPAIIVLFFLGRDAGVFESPITEIRNAMVIHLVQDRLLITLTQQNCITLKLMNKEGTDGCFPRIEERRP